MAEDGQKPIKNITQAPCGQISLNQKQTRRVLSETKAIMSPPECHWMESNFFVEEGELIN